jgi:putative hydrolases of HD superfamily
VADDRLSQQIAFLIEADKLKNIIRRTPLVDSSRQENSAEHSWHLALAVLLLREHVPFEFDLLRALEMLTVHDLVEIDAGDTFAYDSAGQETKAERERIAAERIFGLLPPDQASHLHALWEEFEAQQTPAARVANAMDRLQPLLQNAYSNGGSWRSHHLTRAQVLRRIAPIESTLPQVWPFVVELIDSFCASGLIHPSVNPEP